ncbi:GTP 3',8-cyclase MoaA [Thiothrix subterranea]|uniref:GTP 3',8-cyclase n=1 Tax=Thiothrix subterranea TaxID=2735563 RepID=A0AA51QVK8_9GAMM|nr:GTP 3',8-cyclase MoaA [Thiothrix subterranea]MDQ5768697.1 GTP 3',8-cyclase MoaA [Thiothrix subterranea]WML84848.1 GTP 3',8-cyclase MoaA [Thiothrix subterranea]
MPNTLTDPFGRSINYLRISVTDRCDLRCFYCMPEAFKDYAVPESWLTFDEIERVAGAFATLGVSRIRLTGGEPLVRKGLPELAGRLSAIPGISDLSLSTNANRLAHHAHALQQAGVKRLNVSLDSLQADCFQSITKGRLAKVMAGLMAAKAAGFAPIKLNMVVMAGINDHEVLDMVEFCLEHRFTLRFIETMPVGETGRKASSHYLSLQTVKARLAERYNLLPSIMEGGGPAQYFTIGDTGLRIGFITPVSQHFCATCNRVRLGVDGTLYLCLGHEHSVALRPLLRAGASDEALQAAIREALLLRPRQHDFNNQQTTVMRFMSMTGG